MSTLTLLAPSLVVHVALGCAVCREAHPLVYRRLANRDPLLWLVAAAAEPEVIEQVEVATRPRSAQ